MNDPMNELWRAQQDAATRFSEGWRTLLQPAADPTAQPPAPVESDDRTQELANSPDGGDTTGEVIEPEPEPEPAPSVLDAIQAIRAIRDGQRDSAAHMTHCAELQHELADAMTAWANRQRDTADALDRIFAPFSPESVDGRA